MSYNSFRPLDGYTLTTGNNTFITPWVDAHSSPFISFIIHFSSNSVVGTITLEASDDKEYKFTDGRSYPASAQFVGTYGVGSLGDPIDLIAVPGVSIAVSGNTVNYSVNNSVGAYRWFRIKYTASSSAAGTVTVTCAWKSTS